MSHSWKQGIQKRPPLQAETMLSSPRLLQQEPRCSSDSKLCGYKVWMWDFEPCCQRNIACRSLIFLDLSGNEIGDLGLCSQGLSPHHVL